MTNKCTLLIDGNWLLISRFSVMNNLFRSTLTEEQLNVSVEKLKDMMARSINSVLNRFPMFDNVVFVSDGGSWRKQLPAPSQLDDTSYKGNREDKSKDVSWNHVFKALSGISKACKAQGITTSTQMNIEGDDWIWYWSRRLNAQGINCVIWSSDHDLIQLVQNKGGIFTAWLYEFKGKSEIVFHDSLRIKEPDPNDLDFFMQPQIFKPQLIIDIEKKCGNISYIDPDTIINDKIICGDVSDNIKSVARMKKGGRIYGVGHKEWIKLADQYNIHTIQDLITHKEDVAHYIKGLKKFTSNNDVTIEKILEMMDYNIKLVWLNEDVIPETITAVMNNQDYKVVDVNYFRGAYTTLLGEDSEIQNIFESI